MILEYTKAERAAHRRAGWRLPADADTCACARAPRCTTWHCAGLEVAATLMDERAMSVDDVTNLAAASSGLLGPDGAALREGGAFGRPAGRLPAVLV